MKQCGRCKETKPLKDFFKNKSKKDGLQALCKECKKKVDHKYYLNSPEQNIKRRAWMRDTRRRGAMFVIAWKQANPCSFEGCTETNPVVLEFDHIDRSTKEDTVSNLVNRGASLARIKEEIVKCRVLCANHHRIRTANQFGHISLILSKAEAVIVSE